MKQRLIGTGILLAMVGLMTTVSMWAMVPVAHAAEATTATKQTAGKKVEEKKVVKYIGSSESKKYHKPSCQFAKKISKENWVEFASAAEAKKAGYAPCKVCLPPKPTAAAPPATTSSPTSGAQGPKTNQQ